MADKSKPSPKVHYENNPFFVASNGITLLFNLARGIAILLVIISVITLFGNYSDPTDPKKSPFSDASNLMSSWSGSDWALAIGSVAIILLAVMLVSALLGGVSAYTAARLADNKKAEFREAFHEAFEHLWSYLWLQIIITVKVLLWSLLLIVPGIIMAIRYSLASVAFFDGKKQLRGNAAIRESLRLTQGAWITTYASSSLFNLLTFGAISSLVSTGVNAVLYKQFNDIGDGKKPAAHWLSWVTLFLPAAILLLILLFVVFIAVVIGLSGGHFS